MINTVTNVLQSFKRYFYSSKFAYLSKHSKATNYSILELVAYILWKTATPCKSWTLRNFFTLTSDEWLPLKLLYRYYKMLSSTLSTTINKLFHLSDVTVKSGKRIVIRSYLCISYLAPVILMDSCTKYYYCRCVLVNHACTRNTRNCRQAHV